ILPWWVGWQFFERSERVTWLRWLLKQNPYPQPLEGFLRQLEATRRHDALTRLPRVSCPVLILAGGDDTVCPPRYSQQLKDRLPQARLTVLPGVGHALPSPARPPPGLSRPPASPPACSPASWPTSAPPIAAALETSLWGLLRFPGIRRAAPYFNPPMPRSPWHAVASSTDSAILIFFFF